MDIVYIETSIVSHATAWPSSDPATAVLQYQAKRWMDEQAANYELVTSQIVLAESQRGDADAADRRLVMLADIPVLDENPDTETVAAIVNQWRQGDNPLFKYIKLETRIGRAASDLGLP